MGEVLGWKDIGRAGAYTTSQVARLVRREPGEVLRWVKGANPLIQPGDEPIGGRPIRSFVGVMEARLVSQLVGEGVPLRLIREVSR
ncbi:MAG: hypothetical protein ACK58O_00535, partial [Brevundimonas sp.]